MSMRVRGRFLEAQPVWRSGRVVAGTDAPNQHESHNDRRHGGVSIKGTHALALASVRLTRLLQQPLEETTPACPWLASLLCTRNAGLLVLGNLTIRDSRRGALFCNGASVAVLESLSPRRGALRSMSDKPQTPPEKFQLRPHRCNDRIEDAIFVSVHREEHPALCRALTRTRRLLLTRRCLRARRVVTSSPSSVSRGGVSPQSQARSQPMSSGSYSRRRGLCSRHSRQEACGAE